MKTILLTGFEPFGGETLNPSAEIARQLHGTMIAGHTVVSALLPCIFGASIVGNVPSWRARPVGAVISRQGPVAYWSTLPIKAIVRALQQRGLPSSVSQTAGTFVCNHVFYSLMHELRGQKKIRGGFIHVPWLPEQAPAGQPSLTLAVLTSALAVALETAVKVRRDVRLPGGATH